MATRKNRACSCVARCEAGSATSCADARVVLTTSKILSRVIMWYHIGAFSYLSSCYVVFALISFFVGVVGTLVFEVSLLSSFLDFRHFSRSLWLRRSVGV